MRLLEVGPGIRRCLSNLDSLHLVLDGVDPVHHLLPHHLHLLIDPDLLVAESLGEGGGEGV